MSQPVDGRLAPLLAGTIAPDFTLSYTPSARLSLHNLRGQRIVLVFYPFDWEPVTREQLTLYQTYASEFARTGACLLGVSIDHVWCHEAFARAAEIRFPLLSDFQPRGAVARLYGVYRARQGHSARALFVVDRAGIVRLSQVYADNLNPGVDGILSALEVIASDTEAPAER
ncbi:MAG TPA: redoxin domain-containing protein [Ktedonobacterales bacterium]|nr:redoxin domain-containing protein [Ktedonobacterales bacterium]